ncbi:MAG: amidohydrolase family protein [Planctomycetes bacterium]|nr:amidohydrolase family protein [Planctomycetota bacterium]
MYLNHCHIFPHGAFPGRPELGTLPELDKFMKLHQIEKTIAFAPFWGPKTKELLAGEEINAWLHRNLQDYPNIYGAVTVSPKAPGACALLEEYLAKGFVGVKAHPPVMGFRIDDTACDDFYALAAELGVFVLFHTGVHGGRLEDYQPLLIDNIMARHPKLCVIIEHMGASGGIGRGFFDQALAVIHNHSARWKDSGVYAGLTGLAKPQHRQLVADTIQEAGSKGCIFGLDWPHMEGTPADAYRYRSELDVIHSLGLTPEQEDDVFGGTLATLTGVK